ncbi:hypothetical protein MCOR07_005915 [Pyricularia oryzae]|uniref:Uncharacterized protein n=2 Tax=Pyricularia TaxID=48558 RepID=A0ABQ8NLG5_PYRGI|nr:hypothetical protein MCOR34_010599 [Pyricularia oryzae]KAI6298013.1 hypothetical protein MCOR33_005802 [Pyricularia grisea]KAI6420208.1 hypothetical protein MCOR21_009874 [Pyricularia oryzae]KAI6557255.1 hypothetical protein MCOR04_010145 [Pyricularia oryzae]KAI6595710.1 hypothetical protein MCOR06_002784 [Pyricularia oryzae]
MQLKNITLLFAAFACAAIAAPGGDAPIKARQLPELDTSANVASAAEDTLIRSKRQNIQNPCPERCKPELFGGCTCEPRKHEPPASEPRQNVKAKRQQNSCPVKCFSLGLLGCRCPDPKDIPPKAEQNIKAKRQQAPTCPVGCVQVGPHECQCQPVPIHFPPLQNPTKM